MNKSTQERYERIGAILAQTQLQRKISPLERVLFDELALSDKAFQKCLLLLSTLKQSGDLLSLGEIAGAIGTHEETATVIVRLLKAGGFEFEEDAGENNCLLVGWFPKSSALTYLLNC